MSNKYKNLEDFVENINILSSDFSKSHVFEDGCSIEILKEKSWRWHEPIDVKFKCCSEIYFIISTETDSGCGLINISNYADISKKDIMSIIKLFIKYYTFRKVGALFTTIGDNTPPNKLKAFTESGFKEISEYVNTLHGPNYKQKLLLLDL